MPRPKKNAAKTPDTGDFRITLQLGNETYKGNGATALEALTALPKPHKIFVKGIMTLEHKGNINQFPIPVPRLKRMFYPLSRLYLAKQLDLLIK